MLFLEGCMETCKKRRSLEELFVGYEGSYKCQEAASGDSVGKEF